MEFDVSALAESAAGLVVQLLTTESWRVVKDGVAGLWRKNHPDQVGEVRADLADARAVLRRDAAAAAEVEAEWRARLVRLLRDDLSVRRELEQLIAEVLRPVAMGRSSTVDLRARASGHARIYQAGRDQVVHERVADHE